MSRVTEFLFRRKGGKAWHWTDVVTWIWLVVGLFVMFGPAVWLTASSFKSPAALAEFPPTILPYVTQKVTVEGYDKPLDLYTATLEDGSTATLAEVRRIGTVSQMVDPKKPAGIIKVNIAKRTPVRQMSFATETIPSHSPIPAALLHESSDGSHLSASVCVLLKTSGIRNLFFNRVEICRIGEANVFRNRPIPSIGSTVPSPHICAVNTLYQFAINRLLARKVAIGWLTRSRADSIAMVPSISARTSKTAHFLHGFSARRHRRSPYQITLTTGMLH